MRNKYKILHLEDVPTDAELAARELRRDNIHFDHLVLDDEERYRQALDTYAPDIILCDHSLAAFNSNEALKIFKAKKLNIPFILITATLTDEVAINVLKDGADDYILKDRLKRLPKAVVNSIEKYRLEQERDNLKKETEIKELAARKYADDLSNKLLIATKTAGIGIWEYLLHENKFIADDVLLSLYGITAAEFVGSYESWMQYIHPDDKKRIDQEFRNAVVNHTDLDTEFRNVWPDGSVHFIKGNAIVQRDSLGKPTRLIGTNQDITKSKEAERVLRESEYRLSEAQAVAKVGSWETDLSTLKGLWSLETYCILETAPDDLSASPENFLRFVHPDDRANVDAAFATSLSNNNMNTAEHRIVTTSGNIKTVEERWHIIKDDGGKPLCARGTIQDITERKQSEQLIIESEAKYRSFFESSMDGILLTATDGEIISANPAACEIFKMTEAEICITGRLGLADISDPRLQQLLQERQRTGRVKGELSLIRKDGSKFPGELTSAVFKDVYGQERTSMIVRDITDRKAAEEKNIFQAKLLNTIGQAAISTDISGNINYWNKAAEQMYGWSAKEITGKKISMLVPAHHQSKQKADEIIQQLVQGKSWSGELEVQRKDGTVFPVFVTNSPIYDQHNQLAGILGISTDITERRKAEKAIEESEAFNRGVLDSMSSLIAVIDASGTIIKVNKTWETFALKNGSSTLDFCGVGSNYFDVCTSPGNGTDDIPNLTLDGIKKVMNGTLNEFYLEYPCHSPTEERWSYMRVKKFESNETLALIEHQYITERKKAEEKVIITSNVLQQTLNDLNNIMNSSLDIICTIDEEGRFARVSAASEQIWGYTPDELCGKQVTDMVFDEDRAKTQSNAASVINGTPVTMFENRYIHKDGSTVPMLWSARCDENDKIIYCVAKDATEKKRLEKAFDIAKERFQHLFLQAPSCMGVLKGPTHIYESANPLLLQLLGRTDIIGKTVEEVLPEMKEQGFIDDLNQVYKTGISSSANEILVKIDRGRTGKLVDNYLNLIHQAYKNNDGVIEGIFIFAVDVTEQVLSRRKIEESEKQFRQIIETAQEGIWMIDENNITIFVNDKMCEILEYTREEMMGTSNLSYRDDEERKKTMEQIERRKKGIKETHESQYVTKSGKQIWGNVSTNPILGAKGEYKGALAMVTDITKRKTIEKKLAQSESSLKKAQALADMGNWEIDLENNTQLWSDELYKILGLNKGEITPSTELYLSIIHPVDISFVREKILQSSKSLTGTSFEYRLIKKDDSIKYCYTESRYEFDSNNKPVKLYGVVQDITTRKLAEIERTKMVHDLMQRNKELEQFNYIVSHNLRAPVANIKSFAEALSDKTYPESLQHEFLSHLSVSVSKLDEVTRDLNNVLLIKQKVNDVKEEINLPAVVENIKISIQNLIEQYEVTIETDFTAAESIVSIKSFIHSILYNLISNSIKYRSPEKPPVISIQTRKTPEKTELIFSDNGLGIDLKKNHDKVFGLYKRFHLNIEGKGLGLFITKSQIETLGGTIEVSSEINNGTTFKICLPS